MPTPEQIGPATEGRLDVDSLMLRSGIKTVLSDAGDALVLNGYRTNFIEGRNNDGIVFARLIYSNGDAEIDGVEVKIDTAGRNPHELQVFVLYEDDGFINWMSLKHYAGPDHEDLDPNGNVTSNRDTSIMDIPVRLAAKADPEQDGLAQVMLAKQVHAVLPKEIRGDLPNYAQYFWPEVHGQPKPSRSSATT